MGGRTTAEGRREGGDALALSLGGAGSAPALPPNVFTATSLGGLCGRSVECTRVWQCGWSISQPSIEHSALPNPRKDMVKDQRLSRQREMDG